MLNSVMSALDGFRNKAQLVEAKTYTRLVFEYKDLLLQCSRIRKNRCYSCTVESRIPCLVLRQQMPCHSVYIPSSWNYHRSA